MYVAAGYRRHDIGRLLVSEALAFAETMPGLRRLNLFVSASNLAAIALYESLGFQAYGIERESVYVDGAYHDEILMARTLP